MSLPREASGRFTAALEQVFSMEREDAREIADVVLERFAGRDEVDDESLDADLRAVFYTLESKRILAFRRVEYVREDGDRRRGFYWRVRPEALEPRPRTVEVKEDVDVYAHLPASAWQHAG